MISAETLRELKLLREPEARYDLPKEPEDTPSASQVNVNFLKAVTLIDPIATAAFERYLPSALVIDRSIDGRSFKQGYSHAVMVRRDKPVPSSDKLAASTGIVGDEEHKPEDLLRWLGLEVHNAYSEFGASACSPPLVFFFGGHRHGVLRRKTIPFIGAIVKFALKPKDGQTIQDLHNDWGIMAPREDFAPDHFVDPETVLIPDPQKLSPES